MIVVGRDAVEEGTAVGLTGYEHDLARVGRRQGIGAHIPQTDLAALSRNALGRFQAKAGRATIASIDRSDVRADFS